MMILTLWVTGLGLLSSSSASTRAKWLSCQIGRPSRLSLDNYAETNMRTRRDPPRAGSPIGLYRGETDILSIQTRYRIHHVKNQPRGAFLSVYVR